MPFPVGTWRSLVAYLNGVQGVVGSNLTVPTTHSKWVSCGNPGARNGRRMNVPENEPKEPRSITLLLHCPLRLGLAAGLTQFIYTHGGRILYHEQYVDSDGDHYYTRLKWDVSSFSTTDAEMAERLRALIGSGLETEWSLHNSDQVLRMAVFVSKDPWCLYDILARSGSGEWMVEVPVIVSNHADLESVAGRFGVEFRSFSITKENKSEVEDEQMALLSEPSDRRRRPRPIHADTDGPVRAG